MARSSNTKSSRIECPPVVTTILNALVTAEEVQVTEDSSSNALEPFLFTRVWTLEQLPRNIDSQVLNLFTQAGAERLYNIVTNDNGSDNGSYGGVALLQHAEALALYRLEWFCPEYCDDESDATGTLAVQWAVQRHFYDAHVPKEIDRITTQVLRELLDPLREITDLFDSRPLVTGTMLGTALCELLDARIPAPHRADFLNTLQQRLAESRRTPPASPA